MTPHCTTCGATLTVGAAFCHACGTKVAEERGPTGTNKFSVSAEDLPKKVRELIHEGNVRKVIVKDEAGTTVLEFPVTVGVVGALLAPWLAALGVVSALVTRCTLVVVRREALGSKPDGLLEGACLIETGHWVS